MKSFKKFIPLLIILIILGLFFYFQGYDYLSFTTLNAHYHALQLYIQQHYVVGVLVFMAIYVVVVAASIPGAAILTLTGGFLFGPWLGTLYIIFAASIGAALIFLAVKTALGKYLEAKASSWLGRFEAGIQQNAFSYLLMLRFIPIFPFFVVNIAAGLLEVRLRDFFLSTLIGIIPGTFIYASVGNGLGELFALGQQPALDVIFKPAILWPLVGLAALSLLPVVYKKIKAKKS